MSDSGGLDRLVNSGQTDDPLEGLREWSIGDLEEMFGTSAVARAMSYLKSLEQAQQAYKESTPGRHYKEGLADAFDMDVDELGERVDSATDRWRESMEDKGLGLDDN